MWVVGVGRAAHKVSLALAEGGSSHRDVAAIPQGHSAAVLHRGGGCESAKRAGLPFPSVRTLLGQGGVEI